MVLNKKTGEIKHHHFYELPNLLAPNSTLVFNNSKVIPARIFGHKSTGAKIEIFLIKKVESTIWQALLKPGKRVKKGQTIFFTDSQLKATVLEKKEDGTNLIQFNQNEQELLVTLEQIGTAPLPPYIKKTLDKLDRYQTVYCKTAGSVAAPTAGLHFTTELLSKLQEQEIDLEYLTLHVGLGTFKPMNTDSVEEFNIHHENFELPLSTWQKIRQDKKNGKKIIAVGTTSTRILETLGTVEKITGEILEEINLNHFLNNPANNFLSKIEINNGKITGETNIYIYPPYQFSVIDHLITNFHLPQSSLLVLVSALSSRESILNAYEKAKINDYRFFSFGDGMFIK